MEILGDFRTELGRGKACEDLSKKSLLGNVGRSQIDSRPPWRHTVFLHICIFPLSPNPRAKGPLTFYLHLSLSYDSKTVSLTAQSPGKRRKYRETATQEYRGVPEPKLTWVKSFAEETGETCRTGVGDMMQNKIARCEFWKMKS